jgi:glycosyltransferase involved in cell wall biosynthesis
MLLSSEVRGLFRSENLVLVHWLESRVFTEGRNGAKVRVAGLIQFLIYVVVMLLMRAKLVYFVHDHAVHDLTGWRRSLSVRLVGVLRRLASLRVVHDPSFANRYKAIYLPHPLYEERSPVASATGTRQCQELVVGALGAIRPYKRIEDIIQVWPTGPVLKIRGRADAAYEAYLRQAISKKTAQTVIDMQTGFLSRNAFVAEMSQLDALILPHADASMLVSGAFFEAIGAVPFVIARETPFTLWAATQFSGVLTFKSPDQLSLLIDKASQLKERARNELPATAMKANELFGQATCVRMYGSALAQL